MLLWDELTGTYVTEQLELLARGFITDLLAQSALYTQGLMVNVALSEATQRALLYQLKETIKREYIRQYVAGIGGLDRMGYRDWGSIGGLLRQQYGYLRTLTSEIVSGQISEAQLAQRMSMYANSAFEAYSRAKGRVVSKLGYDEVGWVIAPGAAHCDTCTNRYLMGYTPIGPRGGFMAGRTEVFPGDGSSECLSNCKCGLTYRNSITGKEYEQ